MNSKSKTFIKMKVNKKISNIFHVIISDIPYPSFRNSPITLVAHNHTALISCEDFFVILFRCVSEYVPRNNEHPLLLAVKKLPNGIRNVKKIKANSQIINLQKEILDKYFYLPGDHNLKNKIAELKENIDQQIESGNMEIIDRILIRFEDRMRSTFLSDMTKLSQLMEKFID